VTDDFLRWVMTLWQDNCIEREQYNEESVAFDDYLSEHRLFLTELYNKLSKEDSNANI